MKTPIKGSSTSKKSKAKPVHGSRGKTKIFKDSQEYKEIKKEIKNRFDFDNMELPISQRELHNEMYGTNATSPFDHKSFASQFNRIRDCIIEGNLSEGVLMQWTLQSYLLFSHNITFLFLIILPISKIDTSEYDTHGADTPQSEAESEFGAADARFAGCSSPEARGRKAAGKKKAPSKMPSTPTSDEEDEDFEDSFAGHFAGLNLRTESGDKYIDKGQKKLQLMHIKVDRMENDHSKRKKMVDIFAQLQSSCFRPGTMSIGLSEDRLALLICVFDKKFYNAEALLKGFYKEFGSRKVAPLLDHLESQIRKDTVNYSRYPTHVCPILLGGVAREIVWRGFSVDKERVKINGVPTMSFTTNYHVQIEMEWTDNQRDIGTGAFFGLHDSDISSPENSPNAARYSSSRRRAHFADERRNMKAGKRNVDDYAASPLNSPGSEKNNDESEEPKKPSPSNNHGNGYAAKDGKNSWANSFRWK